MSPVPPQEGVKDDSASSVSSHNDLSVVAGTAASSSSVDVVDKAPTSSSLRRSKRSKSDVSAAAISCSSDVYEEAVSELPTETSPLKESVDEQQTFENGDPVNFAGTKRRRKVRKNSDPFPVGGTDERADLNLFQQFDELASRAKDSAEQFMHHVWLRGWKITPFCRLPDWLKDNDFLLQGHRPQLHTFAACFKSIFRIHTETGNIWTHMLGCFAFIGIAFYFLSRPSMEVHWEEKLVFAAFFLGAVLCLGFSFLFHTVYCHSETVGRLFNKLDYCGIALLTMGSFVPWLYYSFYCQLSPKIIYLTLISILGSAAIVVSMWDTFAAPRYRPLRAGVFIGLGLSGVIPAIHYVCLFGFHSAIYQASMGWLVLMAVLYIAGALIYAVRFPERLFPGKFDYWFQSHQIFHVFVVAAAFVHFHGISEIANYRLTSGGCVVAPNSDRLFYR